MDGPATRGHGVLHGVEAGAVAWLPPVPRSSDGRPRFPEQRMLSIVLDRLRDQLARYQAMARKEREETGCETHGMCAYLDGAIVASQRAVDIAQGLHADAD